MNILQILPELNVGGVETGTVELARELVKLGHQAVVVSNGGVLVKELQAFGVKHYCLPVHKKSIISVLRCIPKLEQILKQEKIDIVHARSRVPAWIAYFAQRRTNAVLITTCHGYYSKHFLSFVMGWAKRVIVLSNSIARHMLEDFQVPHERLRLIPRSVDLERFKYISFKDKKSDEFHVGIIARLTPIKGHVHFIRAMAQVLRAVPRLKVWIVGDAPVSQRSFREELQVLVRRMGLWHCTEFLGTQKDIPEILSHLNVLVLPTTTQEAFGRVIVEAQASGVPVIATKVGGIVDVVEDTKTGLLVPPADHSAISEAVLKLFRDEQLALTLAENAYRNVKEKFTLELLVSRTLAVYREALSNFKILIIKFSSLGDVILSTAAIREISRHFNPGYKISCLVADSAKEALLGCPYIDELIVADFKAKDKGLSGFWKLSAVLRKANFDIVIDLQNNRKSHLLSYLSLSRRRYGYDNGKFAFLLNYRIKDKKPRVNPVRHQFEVLKMLGISAIDGQLELWPAEDDYKYIDDFLSSQWLSSRQRLVGLNLSASSRWLSKSWPLAHLVKLCDLLSAQELRVVVTGSLEDERLAKELAAGVKNSKPINACGRTSVNQLACLIKKCAVFVSADSSPLHVAAAMAVPFVALFGPTDPQRHLPPSQAGHIALRKDLKCSPCYKPKCKTKECMQLITPEEVLEAVLELLK